MISIFDLEERARAWSLDERIVEKDWVIGWILWGIGTESDLDDTWIFKGGTCLKKCYIETYRFSEDLDFTVLPGGPIEVDEVAGRLRSVLARVAEESGINLLGREPLVKQRGAGSVEGRIYYRALRGQQTEFSIKLDLLATEIVVRDAVKRVVSHPYPDTLPGHATVSCYSFEELFAEKIRAMGERGRPRDLYDIVNLYRRQELRQSRGPVAEILEEKCRHKAIPVPTFELVSRASWRAELEQEWESMLRHQLPALPPFADFWSALDELFGWLSGRMEPPVLASAPVRESVTSWAPPATISTWQYRAPLESMRFAGANRLLVDLGYQGKRRLVEPYSLRKTLAGDVLLMAVKAESGELRSYRVDRIETVRITNRSFSPRHAIEFSTSGSFSIPPREQGSGSRPGVRRRARSSEARYTVECTWCGRRFPRKTRNAGLNPHKDKHGYPCRGRRGTFV